MDMGLVAIASATQQMSVMNEINIKLMDKALETVEQNGNNIQKLLDSAIPAGHVNVSSATSLDVYI